MQTPTEDGGKKKKIELEEEALEKTPESSMYGKCQAVGFIWPFGGMTKDLSLKCIMYILLLYGFLNSPFDCSAYDRSVSACFIFLW